MVTYTAKVYYTPEVAKTTKDIYGFVEQIVAETNQGYKNSGVPMKLKVHCIELATVHDTSNVVTMILNFKKMKGTVKKLLGSADCAVLLVHQFNSCGVGYVNGLFGGVTLSVVQKSCAQGYYSFGHEIGHNIGLHHNKEKASNSHYPEGHGYLIKNGYRTILAYEAPGHKTRVNYYSNPRVSLNYGQEGQVTGDAKTADNAKILTRNRFYLAAVGDESEACESSYKKSEPTPSSPTTNPTCPLKQNSGVRYKFQYKHTPKTIGACRDQCQLGNKCIQWMTRRRGSRVSCYHLTMLYSRSSGYISGEVNCEQKPTCQMTEDAGLAYTKRSYVANQPEQCRMVTCPGNAQCRLFSYEASKKTCHLIITYPKARPNYTTGTPCA
eukprot:TRINITY_DN5000_c0_g1_i3.p1 TRINITY_DN5000_c0_g1~~TRINITY_DN5000_c0_g1_i3.p1  ORF type:complete len:381 (+),score=55.28 TRINITY_DN5000_c0_g1_i3:618-1760(+)